MKPAVPPFLILQTRGRPPPPSFLLRPVRSDKEEGGGGMEGGRERGGAWLRLLHGRTYR